MNVKLCPVSRPSRLVRPDDRYLGQLDNCLIRAGITRGTPAAEAFTVKWYRAQMRVWAGHWRESKSTAAILLKSEKEVAETSLALAISYRYSSFQLARQIGGVS